MQEPAQNAPLLLLESISWIDLTAVAVLGVFFVLGLFRGLVWQLSRIVALVASYAIAGNYGADLAYRLLPMFAEGTPAGGLPLYMAYVLLFLGSIVVLGVVAYFLDKLVGRFGLGFYNRLGGALLGGLTGSALVLAGLSLVMMFVPEGWGLARAARASHSMEFSRRSLALLGDTVPRPMRLVFGLEQGGDEAGQDADGDPRGAILPGQDLDIGLPGAHGERPPGDRQQGGPQDDAQRARRDGGLEEGRGLERGRGGHGVETGRREGR